MGLDMYVYRVQSPGLDADKVYDRNEIEGVVLHKDEIDEPMYRQLLPYCDKLRVISHYYNFDKIKEDYGLSEVHIGGYTYDNKGGRTFLYGIKNGENFHTEVSDDVIQEKYIIDKEEPCYVCCTDEIRYWRKAYDVQDWFHDNIDGNVENTGYYILDEDLREAFNREFPDDTLPDEETTGQYAYFYWEWY